MHSCIHACMNRKEAASGSASHKSPKGNGHKKQVSKSAPTSPLFFPSQTLSSEALRRLGESTGDLLGKSVGGKAEESYVVKKFGDKDEAFVFKAKPTLSMMSPEASPMPLSELYLSPTSNASNKTDRSGVSYFGSPMFS